MVKAKYWISIKTMKKMGEEEAKAKERKKEKKGFLFYSRHHPHNVWTYWLPCFACFSCCCCFLHLIQVPQAHSKLKTKICRPINQRSRSRYFFLAFWNEVHAFLLVPRDISKSTDCNIVHEYQMTTNVMFFSSSHTVVVSTLGVCILHDKQRFVDEK